MKALIRICVVCFCVVLFTGHSAAQDRLANEFVTPPAESKMASYWWVFGPAWTKPEIQRELQVLKNAGIGRVLLFPLYPYEVDNPAKGIVNQNYLSPEFLDTLRYALISANKMDISVDLVMGTGWPYGGPQIPASLSPKRIYSETTPVAGQAGEKVTVKLPVPAASGKIVAVQLVSKDPAARTKPMDLTDRVAGGSVAFVPPQGEWELMTFLEGPTLARHTVVFAAAGAGGNVIDHLSKQAVELYLKTVCDKLAVAGKGRIRAMYSPSFEVYGTSWTDGFLSDFQKRRGYDLRPHLAALFRDQPDTSNIRYDYWKTVSEISNENYLGTISKWSRAHGFKFESESYGEPPVTQASYSYTDYPMGEEYDWKEFNMMRWTSSAAHFFNHTIISDEAYTGLMEPSRYNESLEDLKRTSDAIFVSGANRLVAHGYGYSPPSAGSPGWGYFAGAMLTEHQTWWPYFHYLSSYVHRTGFLLSQGLPVVDVLVYLPEGDLYAEHPPGQMPLAWWVEGRLDRKKAKLPDYGIPKGVFDYKSDLISTIITNGYSLDGIDHSVLAMTGTTDNGRLHVGQGSYSILVLPGAHGLPIADFEKLAEFCREGGTLITTLQMPKLAYGHVKASENAIRLAALDKELYGGMENIQSYQTKRVGEGRSIFVKDETAMLQRALHEAGPADIDVNGGLTEMGFAHRHTTDHDIYFLANFTTSPRKFQASFNAGNRTPKIFDPMTGKTAVARHFKYAGNRTVVDLDLEPYGSIFVVIGPGRQAAPARAAAASKTLQPPISFHNAWKLSWDGLKAQPVELAQLKSWTDFPAAKYFSGRGTYETTINVPAGYFHSGSLAISQVSKSRPFDKLGAGSGTPASRSAHTFLSDRLLLDMGDVKSTAEVWINGRHVGVAWKIPYVLDVTGYLRPGSNQVRVDVTNLLINQVLNQPTKDYSDVEAKYPGLKVPAPREKAFVKTPLPSGLLGPVLLKQAGRSE